MYKRIIQLRSTLLVYLTHRMALPVLRLIRKPEIFPFTPEELKSFPDDTLGKDLVNFLEIKQLDLLPYYARHDIKHILLGYDTTDEGEGCLQCFMLEQACFIPGNSDCAVRVCNHAGILVQFQESICKRAALQPDLRLEMV